ncbi:MAG: hypothetical protein PF517_21190 [Salinivirgaceae bacterium]|nr:hypothetical protein [Salinivirgaceae bacterium]
MKKIIDLFNKFIGVFGNFIDFINKRYSHNSLFWISIITICFIYGYNNIIFERPSGIHQWRNCVSAGYPVG